MLQELITLDLRITVPEPSAAPNATVASKQLGVFNREVASFGYTLGADVLARLAGLDDAVFGAFRNRLLAALEQITGANASHQALFRRFPYETPDDRTYFESRVIGFMQNLLDVPLDAGVILSCGHVIDTSLFDLDAFGACPICQNQVPELVYTPSRPNAPAKPVTPLKVLHLADDAWLSARGSALLARQSSLSGAEKALLIVLAGRVPLTMPAVLYKETLPFAYRLLGREAVRPHLSGATDVLRIAAHLSAEDADLSLAKAPRLHLSTRERQDMLALLEGLDDIAEDLLRHIGPWKRFAKHVHIGQARYPARYPRTVAAFEHVRHDFKAILTYDRIAERALRAGQVDRVILDRLAQRPGSFLRRLDHILRVAGEAGSAPVLDALARVAPAASPRLVLTVKKHLEYRQEPNRLRVFLPKGNANLVQVVEDRRAALAPALLHAA